jgi:amino acid adenylation domain-containing protein
LQEHFQISPANVSLSNISEAKRKLLEKYLRGELKQQPTSPRTIATRSPAAIPQLSFAQERLWFLDQLNPGSAVYNVPLAVRLSGPIDAQALEQSVNEIVRRHEILRTTFATVDGRPVPSISFQLKVDLQIHDLTSLPKNEREARAHLVLHKESASPFNLTTGPLIRATLVNLTADQHIFLVVMHHIVSDGWSLVLFFQELTAIYDAFSRGEQSPLPDTTIQYADYAAWQREWLQGELLQKQLSYWTEQLDGELPVLELPTDRPRPAVQTFNGAREWLVFPEPLTESILALAQREGVTSFMILLAAFKILLYRYSGHDDVIVGSPIASRPQTETESIIGFFLNNLALRTDLSGEPSFRALLTRVKKTALSAYAHQDVPFEKLIDALKPRRDLSRTPIFQVYFNLFNFGAEISLPGSDKTVSFVQAWEQSEEDLSKFDLTLYAGLQGRKLKLAFVYNTDLFDADTVRLMLVHFRTLLESVVANPEESISDLPLRAQTSAAWESFASARVRPANEFIEFRKEEIEQSIATRFASQVAMYPERLAVKSKNHKWTYAELNAAVNRIAQSILRAGGDREERIALLFDHDAPMIAGMLGALSAGKTYVPLDPHHPKARLLEIIQHSEATLLLTNNKNLALARELTNANVRLVNTDSTPSIPANLPAMALPAVEPNRLAYILYTSGSTGEPKGVMQNHRNVLHYIRVYTNNLHLNAQDRLSLFSSYCFDASVMDIYGALLNGATLCPIDIREAGLAGLAEQLIDDEITVYHSTPTVYRYFLGAQASLPANVGDPNLFFPKVRLVVLGGEKVDLRDLELYRQHFSDDCIFVNGLGPTEATVSLQNFIDKETEVPSDSVPVGFAVEDTEVLLLNPSGRPSEVFGEIAIKSAHVALGYWRNNEATAKAFGDCHCHNRLRKRVGLGRATASKDTGLQRIYRTGDMGRRLPDGSIKFEGRKDFQVKIRGFRVELGEIESALVRHPNVREGVVVARDSGHGDTRLIAYVVPHKVSITIELRHYLQQRLPEYMVPGSFVMIESLPLTPSGKLDRRALPTPESVEAHADDTLVTTTNTPETRLKKMLAAIWSELLEVRAVGVNDNFFELGGHSLLAVRLFAQIEKRLGKRLPLSILFQAPTVGQLAAVIQKDWTPEWSSLVEIQSAGFKTPFFCVHALGGNVLEYYDLARHLGEDQPFYGLQSQGLDGKRPPHTRVEDMAAHYIKEMRELQPEGPYLIGGRSLGGMVAFEMAQQLKAQGQTIGLLALLDTYPSGYAKLFRNEKTLRAAFGRGLRRAKAHVANLRSLSVNEGLSYVIKKARFAPRKMKSQIWRRVYQSYENLGRPLPRMLKDVKEFNSLAVREYVPQVYDGKVTLFWASEDLRTSIDLVEGWRVLAGGGMEVHEIPGSHLDIVKEPHVGEVAKKLGSCLEYTRSTIEQILGATRSPT